jgi:hypothetical protein
MKNLRARVLLMFFLAMTAGSVHAEQGWIFNVKVTNIVVTSNGGINVRITPSLTGCTSQAGYGPTYASIYPSHPGINRIASTLMTAYTLNKEVSIYLTDSTCIVSEVVLGVY